MNQIVDADGRWVKFTMPPMLAFRLRSALIQRTRNHPEFRVNTRLVDKGDKIDFYGRLERGLDKNQNEV